MKTLRHAGFVTLMSCSWFAQSALSMASPDPTSNRRFGESARPTTPARSEPPNTVEPIYHADPQHLWNRLHGALFIRVGPDGNHYGVDRLEPLLWHQSKHLLEQGSHNRAVRVLSEFVANAGERLIDDPLKRAILQRDLWMVFNWVTGEHGRSAEPHLEPKEVEASQKRLLPLLASGIRRLALPNDEIQSLPDNYAAAVRSGVYPARFEPERADNPYLPVDLWSTDSPWISVGRTDAVTAPQHLRGENPFTNSVFVVFVRLPGDRANTANYLEKLLAFDQPPLVPNPAIPQRRSFPFAPNPQLPPFPTGTEVALVRRALLIDSSHRLVISPLTESIQLRVMYGNVPDQTRQLRQNPAGYFREVRQAIKTWQSFQEFRLSRTALFRELGGGLHAVGPSERDFKTGFAAHTWDEIERKLRPDQSFLQVAQPVTITGRCFACHSMPGVYSFNSLKIDFRFAMQRRDADKEEMYSLSVMSPAEVTERNLKWKKTRPHWIALHALLAN